MVAIRIISPKVIIAFAVIRGKTCIFAKAYILIIIGSAGLCNIGNETI